MKLLSIFSMLTVLAACDAGFGITRLGDTIHDTGTLNCTVGSAQEQALVVGTEADPVRCGPQAQPIVQ
jgi:hypothetical protein